MNIVKISKLEKINNTSVLYDISTVKNHNFFANDILVHNSNLSFIFDRQPDGEFAFSYGKRSGLIAENENFYGIQDVVNNMGDFIAQVIKRLKVIDDTFQTFTLYGEFCGPGIQKRINYGNKKRILFFDLAFMDVIVSAHYFQEFMKKIDINGEYTIPIRHIATNFDEAMKYDTHFNSDFSDAEDNECEGVVIKPYYFDKPYVDKHGHMINFFIKNKNEKFTEKMKTKHKKPGEPLSDELMRVQRIFERHLNDNRIKSVFSKEGEIEDHKDIGKYIKLIVQDAKDDFMKDYEDDFKSEKLSDKERAKVFSGAGKVIVPLLKNYL